MLVTDAGRCAGPGRCWPRPCSRAGRHMWLFARARPRSANRLATGFFNPALGGLTHWKWCRPGQPAGRECHAQRGPGSTTTIVGPGIGWPIDRADRPGGGDRDRCGVSTAVERAGAGHTPYSALQRSGAPSGAGPAGGTCAAGWAVFRSPDLARWSATVQFTPVQPVHLGAIPVARADAGPAVPGWRRCLGAVMACYGAGSVLGGPARGRAGGRAGRSRSPRPSATFGYPIPGPLLAAARGSACVAAGGALAAGAGSALGGVFATTAEQEQFPAGALARVTAIQTVTSFASGRSRSPRPGGRRLLRRRTGARFRRHLVRADRRAGAGRASVRQVRSGPASPVTE